MQNLLDQQRKRGKRSREKVKEQHGGHASLLPQGREAASMFARSITLQLLLIWSAGLQPLTTETGSISRPAAQMSLGLTDRRVRCLAVLLCFTPV